MPVDDVPKTPAALDGEVSRLRLLRDELWESAAVVTAAWIGSWVGSAHDNYEDFRLRLARRWWDLGKLCDEAADALDDYRQVASELQHRMSSQGADQRLVTQAVTAADDTARRLEQITEQLDDLNRLLEDTSDELSAPVLAVPPPEPTMPPVVAPLPLLTDGTREQPNERRVAPTMSAVHELFRRRLAALNAQLLVAPVGVLAI